MIHNIKKKQVGATGFRGRFPRRRCPTATFLRWTSTGSTIATSHCFDAAAHEQHVAVAPRPHRGASLQNRGAKLLAVLMCRWPCMTKRY